MNEALALSALCAVETLAAKLGAAEVLLESGYAEFAAALLVVQDNQYWMVDYPSWTEYLQSVADKYRMGSRQLMHKIAVVKELKGAVSSADLTEMGITKAAVLADAHRASNTLPEGIVATAKTEITAKELKQALAEALHAPKPEQGEWYDMGFAFMVTAEEKATLVEAERILRQIDPPISTSIKTFQQKKEVALRMAAEVLATYTEPQESF